MPSLFDQICYQGPQAYNVPKEGKSYSSYVDEHSYFGNHLSISLFVDREWKRENYTYRENQAIHYQGVCEFCSIFYRFILTENCPNLCVE